VVERCPAEMWRCWPELGWTEWHKAEPFHPDSVYRHRAARLTWCRRYLRFRIQDWANILSTDESRFHLDSSDGRSRVYRRVGERYADACVIQRQDLTSGIDFPDAPASCGYLDDVTLHLDDLNVCSL
jgi:hypothetical protein